MVDVRSLLSQSLITILFKSITVPMMRGGEILKYRVSKTVTMDMRSFLIMLLKAMWPKAVTTVPSSQNQCFCALYNPIWLPRAEVNALVGAPKPLSCVGKKTAIVSLGYDHLIFTSGPEEPHPYPRLLHSSLHFG